MTNAATDTNGHFAARPQDRQDLPGERPRFWTELWPEPEFAPRILAVILEHRHAPERGLVNPTPQMAGTQVAGSITQLDAGTAMDFLSSHLAMDTAMDLAPEADVGMVGVHQLTHFGMGALFALQVLEKNFVSMIFTNSSPANAMWSGRALFRGVSPVAADFPASKSPPFVMDIAMTVMGMPGEKGIASIAGREVEFRHAYAHALDYAEEVGCPFVHPMAGVGSDHVTYRNNVEAALDMAAKRSPQVLVEAINQAAVPGYHMCHIDDLLALARDLPALRLLIDTYHAAADGHDPTVAMRAAGASLAHVHIADHPGRGQPGSGQIVFAAVLKALDEMQFGGAIGFEYLPKGAEHLAWLPGWKSMRDDISRMRTKQ